MDPSQLALIKQLIAEAEAKLSTAPAATTNHENKPASVGGTHAEVMDRPAPVATPCRSTREGTILFALRCAQTR